MESILIGLGKVFRTLYLPADVYFIPIILQEACLNALGFIVAVDLTNAINNFLLENSNKMNPVYDQTESDKDGAF